MTDPKRASGKGPKQDTTIGLLAEYVRLAQGDGQAGSFLAESYAAELRNADKQQGRWRRVYYQWRGFVIVASATITVLTAINIHGGAVFAVRALTLVLSALVTVCTGLLELLQVNHRWRIYRQLRYTLERLGWRTALQAGAAPTASLASLGNGLISAMHDFETRYMAEVAAASDGVSGEPQRGKQPKLRAGKQPKSHAGKQPKSRAGKQPKSRAGKQPKSAASSSATKLVPGTVAPDPAEAS